MQNGCGLLSFIYFILIGVWFLKALRTINSRKNSIQKELLYTIKVVELHFIRACTTALALSDFKSV